jgi:hypothetical protein
MNRTSRTRETIFISLDSWRRGERMNLKKVFKEIMAEYQTWQKTGTYKFKKLSEPQRA